MTPQIKECILTTLLNKDEVIKDLTKYELVISYLDNYSEEICNHILQAVNLEYPNYSVDQKINLLKNINYCLSKAYEYIYFLELSKEVTNKTR